MMKKSKLYLAGILLSATSLVGCSDFLLPLPNGTIPEDNLWEYPAYIEGFVGRAYTYMPKTYADNQGFYLDGATDDAVITSLTHAMNRFGNGTMGTSNDVFEDNIYINSYEAIVSVNRFLEDDKGLNTRYSTNDRENELKRHRLQGEAFGLRAWFEWQLLKYYGGVGASSKELLGISILTDAFEDLDEDVLWTPRSTYEDSMTQIESDCNAAFKYLAVAHRDHLKEDPLDVEAGAILWGCLDQMALKAMLSEMYLTYASPLYNPEGLTERWEKAAKQASEVIELKRDIDGGYFDESMAVNWSDPNYIGIIYPSNYTASNLAVENAFYPASVQGNGSIGATQELVDAFPMANGYPITHEKGKALYNPQYPYVGRDPRFYSAIFYNGSQAKVNNTGNAFHTFNAWTSDTEIGEDYAGTNGSNLTNLYIKKFIYMNYNPFDNSKKKGGPRSKYLYRWSQILLNFAEAANEACNKPTDKTTINGVRLSMSAKEAMALIRGRKTYDGETPAYATNDPYLNEVALDRDLFREFIRNERRLETCFEGLRFFDLRRWSNPVEDPELKLLNATLHRPEIKRDAVSGLVKYSDGESTPHVEVLKRKFTTPYLPIPYAEILRTDGIEQNQGWESWQ